MQEQTKDQANQTELATDETSASVENNADTPQSSEQSTEPSADSGAEPNTASGTETNSDSAAEVSVDTSVDAGEVVEEFIEEPEVDVIDEFSAAVGDAYQWVPDWAEPFAELIIDHPILAALLLAISGYFLGKLVAWLLHKVVGNLTRRTRSQIDDAILTIIERPVFMTVFFGSIALGVLNMGMMPSLTKILLRILATVLTLFIAGSAFKICALLLKALAGLKDKFAIVQSRTLPLFDIISKVVLVIITSYALLMIWNIDPTAWLASAGVLGIAVGFAAKDTLANLFSGVFIVADSPYKIGDFVNLDSGERGMVTHVGLRSTRLLTRDDIEITVPNAVIANSKIINESGGTSESCRIRIPIGVAYGSDVDHVCETLMGVANSHKEVLKRPEARVRMREFADSSVNFELLCWIDQPVKRGLVKHELMMSVYKTFASNNIEIPFPQQDIYIKQVPKADAPDG